MESCVSAMRCIENMPVVGHMLAGVYACTGDRSRAERAAVKATLGIILFPVSIPAEIYDEATRKRPEKLAPVARFIPRPDWMKRYKAFQLNSICLPGSHQSGTYKATRKMKQEPMVIGWTKCQTLNIFHQLMCGVRFLDIRIMSYKGDIWTHSDVVLCVRLRDVLVQVRDFVAENPTEIVLVHMTNDRKEVDWSTCHLLIMEVIRDRLVPTFMKDLPIGDIIEQGKNIIVSGVQDFSPSWDDIQYRVPDKPSPSQLRSHMEASLQEMGLYRPTTLYWYRAECTPTKDLYMRSAGGLLGLMASRSDYDKFDFVEELAEATHAVILNVLSNLTTLPFNILSMDYVSDQVVARIIQLNENADRVPPMTQEDAMDELDDVFLQNPTLKLMNTTASSSMTNSSFQFRMKPSVPVQVRETNM